MKKLFLDADPNQVSIKQLLGRDFLELSMRTVSSANPNRNGSWFTKESQEKALATYSNRPVLAFFKDGDFVSHNGEWKNDSATGMDFWDTLGSQGERPIGMIREGDRKEVVLDEETGLYWTEITCALWTQYSYRQVKRLIEDAQKAALTGGPTKSISVEVDITDYEELPNGVLKINDYVLQGITILGSRNGRKVEPGIAGAQLTVLDVISSSLYERQSHALMQAYEALDAQLKTKEVSPMEKPMENDNQLANQQQEQPQDQGLAAPADPQDNHAPENQQTYAEEGEGDPKLEAVKDLAWLIESCTYKLDLYDETMKHYEELGDIPGKRLIIAKLKRMRAATEADISDLGKLLALVTSEDFSEDEDAVRFEEDLAAHCCLPEVYKELLEKQCECQQFREKCEAFEQPCPECGEHPCVCEKKKYEALQAEYEKMQGEYEKVREENDRMAFEAFIAKAASTIDEAKPHLGEAIAKEMFERCQKKEITTFEALQTEIALAVGRIALSTPNKNKNAYSAPLPTSTPAPAAAAEAPTDVWGKMGYKKAK